MANTKASWINFYQLFKDNGFYTTDEDGNEVLDGEKVKSEIGITESAAQGFIEGYNNPLRGKNYNAVIDYFELDVANARAFLRWRAEQWKAWEDAGYPEEGPLAEIKDSDYAGEYYEEELASLEPEEEEEDFSEDDGDDEFTADLDDEEDSSENEEEDVDSPEFDEEDEDTSDEDEEFTL